MKNEATTLGRNTLQTLDKNRKEWLLYYLERGYIDRCSAGLGIPTFVFDRIYFRLMRESNDWIVKVWLDAKKASLSLKL